MDRSAIFRAMPGIRQRFDDLKAAVRDGRLSLATSFLTGECVTWGEALALVYDHAGRAELAAHDPLTRFFVTRLRGMPEPADIGDAPGAARFLMAFTAFPYLDALMEETTIGDWVAENDDGSWRVAQVLAGEGTDDTIVVEPGTGGVMVPGTGGVMVPGTGGGACRFDLMCLYRAKAAALDGFIGQNWAGDFDAFLRAYVADHDLMFDLEQAWTPPVVK